MLIDLKDSEMEILKYPDDRLRVVSRPVAEITSEIRDLCRRMLMTMMAADGIGLAAPQVGEPLRIFVMLDDEYPVFINPSINKLHGEVIESSEGCLSFPELGSIPVKHYNSVVVSAYDLNGKLFAKNYTGLAAQCVQHEVRHLDGALLIDHVTSEK